MFCSFFHYAPSHLDVTSFIDYKRKQTQLHSEMVGGHLRYSNCLFTCSTLLLLRVSFYDVEASSCPRVIIHKKVGDTVEFSSCFPTEGVTEASWTYGGLTIARKDNDVSENHQFRSRSYLNPTNFSLTVKSLTLQDSGDFSFISEANDNQRPSVTVTLRVYEPITKPPVLTSILTWHSSNGSCTFLLDCSASHSNVSYNWTVRNQTRSGSRLQFILREEDGDTEFTCTVYNVVSEMSTSKTVKCSNETTETPDTTVSSSGGFIAPLIIGLIIGVLLMFMLLYFTKSKGLCRNRLNQPEPVNQNETQQHIYSSLLHGDGSVYETVRGSEAPGTGGPPNQ